MKKVFVTIGMVVLYFVICFACMFLGFLSPITWVYYSVFAAFFAATPVLVVASKWKKPGAIALFSVVWMLILGLMGEISSPAVWVTYIITTIAAEAVRFFIGYDKQLGLRVGYAVNSIGLAGSLLPLWLNTDWYYEGAIEEMESVAYADGLMKLANPVGLILLIVFVVAAAYVGCIVAEKLFKDKVKVDNC